MKLGVEGTMSGSEKSSSTWRTWVEITLLNLKITESAVVLHTEDVD